MCALSLEKVYICAAAKSWKGVYFDEANRLKWCKWLIKVKKVCVEKCNSSRAALQKVNERQAGD